jgi:hypothetical protein
VKRIYFCNGCPNKDNNCKAGCANYKLKPSYYKANKDKKI